MDTPQRIDILQQYSSEEYLKQFGENKASFSLPEDKRQELLEALGADLQKKDREAPDGIRLNKVTIQTFCKHALRRLLDESVPKAPEDFDQVKTAFIAAQLAHLQKGIHIGDIREDSEGFEHTQQHKLNYRSGSFEEKWKATFGFDKNFTPHSNKPNQIKILNQEYLPLNPEKLESHPDLLDFILHGKVNKGYSFTETQILLYEMMKNPDIFKQKLLSYKTLVLPTEGGYSEELSERIVAYPGATQEENTYLITENTPQIYEERHLRKYTGNTIRFTPFLDKDSAFNYLLKQLLFGVDKQIERVNAFYADFRLRDSFPVDEETNTLLEGMYAYFSHYRSKADQEIALACGKALHNNNVSHRNQIIKGLIQRLPEMRIEIKKKAETMEQHFAAFRDNRLF